MTRWVERRPGLVEAAAEWEAELEPLLERAARRARRVLAPPVPTPLGLAQLADLARRSAPRAVPALLRRDGEAAVTAFADTAIRGGPTFVKLGQLVSSTKGLTPDWVADAFAGCRDAVPPAPTELVEKTLARSGVLEALSDWDPVPIASASVAQVHRATLDDGTDAVLKIRRPGLLRIVSGDMSWLLPALRIFESRNDAMRIANLSGSVELMARMLAQEVDLRIEAGNIAQMARSFERAGVDIELPVPVPGLVTERVLVMERIDGVASGDQEGVAALGHHAATLVRVAVVGVLESALDDGVFHGDLHPGNVLVTPRGLALVDFGIVGRLDEEQRRHLLALLVAAFAEDRGGVFHALRGLGALPDEVDPEEFVELLPPPPTVEERMEMLRDRTAMMARVTQIVRTLSENHFQVTPELSLFAKNLLYLGDAMNRHAPDYDVLAELPALLGGLAARLGGSAPA